MSTNGPTYILTLRPLPDAADPGGIRRLRALVKAALRSYRLRCVGIRPAVGVAPGMTDVAGVDVAQGVAK
jgi:hypothetical protein